MEQYAAHFEISHGIQTPKGIVIPNNYDFWTPLMSYFIKKSTHFRIDCWINEKEPIDRAKDFGSIIDTDIKNMKIFEGKITDDFIKELIYNPFDDEGKIKWFSIFLMKGEEDVISSEHYGREFATGWLGKEDINYISSIIPKEFRLDIYNKEQI